ncbi:MAG TPA: OmpA family protein [Acetobacteraceae bacterium]|jgi:outer membrane protein OmpA-like peptidoglycan-associated protein|nr:OmpA family protein [Acetobacteraceae bacterium]
MRYFLLLIALLLCPAAPGLAQVTVDLHALDALPHAPGSPPGRPVERLPPPGVASARPAVPARRPTVATAQPTEQAARPAGSPPAAPSTTLATAQPTAPAPAPAAPAPPAASQAAPPAATIPVAPPAVASLTPIQPPPAPVNAAPPPPPPIDANAATTAAATQAGLRLTFATGQSDLSPGSADSIKHLVQTAPPGDNTTFNVLAYASGEPDDPSVARRLSLARAIAVRDVLLVDGVPSSHIYLRALGSQPGQVPTDRVDVSVLGANGATASGQ